MPIYYPRRLISMYRKTMALQSPHSRIKVASQRLRTLRSLTRQRPWSVMIAETTLPSGIDINTSRCISPMSDRSLTLDRRHRKRHDRPHKCDIDECQLAFAFNRDLQRHIVSVHPKNPRATSQGQYYCPHPGCARGRSGCRGGFPRKDTLGRHLKTHRTRNQAGKDTQ
jgi:hypothetical protein